MPPNNKFVEVSGVLSYEDQKITFPSGQFGVRLNAYLSQLNATFGFNSTPHRFELEYIPELFSSEALPIINSEVEFTIGEDFYIKGSVVHSDYSKGTRGNVLSVVVEDDRTNLNTTVVDTYGVFGAFDIPSSGIVDVRYWYLVNYVNTRLLGRSAIIKDLFMLDKHGASYRQIYEAVKYFEEVAGTINGIIDTLPAPEVIQSQLPFDAESYRWKFRSQSLLEVLGKILSDISMDYYWNMKEGKVNVINKKYPIDISADSIPAPNDPAPISSLKFGKDKGEDPTAIQIYGAQMEGILCRDPDFGNPGGAYGLSSGVYNLGIGPIDMRFIPAWREVNIRYFGPDGSIRLDNPTDRHCLLALKGIEFWAAEHDIENRITVNTFEQDTGLTIQQASPSDESIRPGLIPNRAQLKNAWVIEWYNKVRSFAQNYFGRAYKLDPTCSLWSYLDNFQFTASAWCNLENLSNEGFFTDNYHIQDKYKVLSPFWDVDANKLKAFAIFPETTKWGEDGKGTATQFENWNEFLGLQFVPIEIRQWDKSHSKFEESYLRNLTGDEKGLLIRLPNICWSQYGIEDPILSGNPLLQSINLRFDGRTRSDFENPISVGVVYEGSFNPNGPSFTVALPVSVDRRYGYQFPFPWASGNGPMLEVQINDELAPWNYEPRGTRNSVQQLTDDAKSIISARVVNRDTVSFAEAQKIGLPIISFDNFANQNEEVRGFGIVQHGITSLNITKSLEWWQTRYSIKSHFPQLVKIKPAEESPVEDFAFVIHKLQDDIRRLLPVESFAAPNILEHKTELGNDSFVNDILDKFDKIVTISQIGDQDTANPFYGGLDSHDILWPRGLDSIYSSSSFMSQYRTAFCIDGYLQIGMQATYHYEELANGTFIHYFTGGFPLTAGRIVELTSNPTLLHGIWVANCRTLPTVVSAPGGGTQVVHPFRFNHVPFMSQQSVDTTASTGDKLMISSHGNKNKLTPNGNYGPSESNDGDAYLVNTAVPNNLLFLEVLTPPNISTGRGGIVRTIGAVTPTTYTDATAVGGKVYNLYFVGTEYENVEIGDKCIGVIAKEASPSTALRLVMFAFKPSFSGTDSFGG